MEKKKSKKTITIIANIFGVISLIPFIGFPFGVIAIIIGLVKKQESPVILGVIGVLITLGIRGLFGRVANNETFQDLRVQLVDEVLVNTSGQILIYEKENGKLPENLDKLEGDFVFSTDPWGNEIEYTQKEDNSFELRSAGPDEMFNTQDDILKGF